VAIDGTAPAVYAALHPDRQFVDEPDRTVLHGSHAGLRTGGQFPQRQQLIEAIEAFLEVRNQEPERYIWRPKGEDILRKIQKARGALNQVTNS
jgi:hypothetical protein